MSYPLRNDEEAPLWIQRMYAPDADPGEVQKLYDAYYLTHPFVKNQHTQYYKRWLRSFSKNITRANSTDQRYLAAYEQQQLLRSSASWIPLGPYDWDHDAAGRSYAPGSAHVYTVEQSVSSPNVLFAGTANAGVWKSTDHGEHWSSCTHAFVSGSVTAIEIHPSNTNIIYAELNQSIYKSSDGGSSWTPTGDAGFQALEMAVRDIRCHPDEPQKVFAATNAGLYRSLDNGTSWINLFPGDFQEIEFHPTRPDTVYAVRKDGMRTRFYRSYNNGGTFIEASSGWPSPNTGAGEHQERTEIAVTPDAPNNVYALATGSANGGSGLYGVYVSYDFGITWTFRCCGPSPGGPPSASNQNLMGWSDQGLDDGGQYYYDLAFAVSPTNKDSIWVCGVNLWVSGNEGASFVCPSAWSHSYKPNYVHADIHDLHFFEHSGELWLAGDGGIFYSDDLGANFHRRNVGILGTDFWGFGQGHWAGDVMLGGAYHNGTMLREDSVYLNGWICTDGGDGVGGYVNPGYDRQVYSWFNIKALQSDRTVDPLTRDYYNQPNSTYITGQSSDLLFHPHYYGTWYTGSGNKLLKTTDNGNTFQLIRDFGVAIAAMDLCIADPDVIYVCTFPGWWDIKRIYRTTDGGQNWQEVTPPENILNHPNDDWVPYDIVVSDDDPMKVWIARTSMYNDYPNINGFTVYRSVTGGTSWTNISGSGLTDEYPTCIALQRGSDDALYVGTRRAVYYRDAPMSDWTMFNTGLPARIHSVKLVPWYKKGVIRNATDRSVWESPFHTSSQPIAIPSVQKEFFFCERDTAYFTDLSVLRDLNATWSWSFPGGSPATSNLRNPKVVYTQTGQYDVTLVVSDQFGTDTAVISKMISVDNRCHIDETAGGALKQNTHPDYVKVQNLDLQVTHFTITAWVKPNGIQSEYTSLFMNDGNAAGFNFRESNNTLAYHWPGGAWWWDSGLEVPANQWSYVAMVVQPGSVTLYVNGIAATHSTGVESVLLGNVRIGNYQGWDGRTFKGEIDEMCLWNRALTIDEIRLLRHVVKDPAADNTIKAYYQFDANIHSGFVVDKAGGKDGILNAGAAIVPSNAPVGKGTSEIKTITTNGLTTFNNGGDMAINFSGTNPNGKVVATHLITLPDTVLDGRLPAGGHYIINNYGSNQVITVPVSINFKKAGSISQQMDNDLSYVLYKRASNATGMVWTHVPAGTVDKTSGLEGEVTFSSLTGLTSFSQFLLMRDDVMKGVPDIVIANEENANAIVRGGPSMSLWMMAENQGLKLPVVNSDELQLLGEPAEGQFAFVSDSAALFLFNGTGWRKLSLLQILQSDIATDPGDLLNISMDQNGISESSILSLGAGLVKPPSFTEAEIVQIKWPAQGMMIYNSTAKALMVFDGNQWSALESDASDMNVSSNTSQLTSGIAVNQNSKHPGSSLEAGPSGFKTFQLPVVRHQEIFMPAVGLCCFDPDLSKVMVYDGMRWNILQ